MKSHHRQGSFGRVRYGVGLVAAALVCLSSVADDTEIYTKSSNILSKPNILFILDTSGSMNEQVEIFETSLYDPTKDYQPPAGKFNFKHTPEYYYVIPSIIRPTCNDDPRICDEDFDQFRVLTSKAVACDPLAAELDAYGRYDSQKLAIWVNFGGGNPQWFNNFHGGLIATVPDFKFWACEGYDNYNGNNKWATTEDIPTKPWATTPPGQKSTWENVNQTHSIYNANYMNWYNYEREKLIGDGSPQTRLSIVIDELKRTINTAHGLNIGLMRFQAPGTFTSVFKTTTGTTRAADSEGGVVLYPISNIDAPGHKDNMIAELDKIATDSMNVADSEGYRGGNSAYGTTPLTETLHEAMLYFQGKTAKYGANPSRPFQSHADSFIGSGPIYDSPIGTKCDKNYAIVFTDGEPSADHSSDADLSAPDGLLKDLTGNAPGNNAPDKMCSNGGYASPPWNTPYHIYFDNYNPDGDSCLDELAQYMYEADHDSGKSGVQNIFSYFVGGFDINDPTTELLDTAAKKGSGGKLSTAFSAITPDQFQTAFSQILADIKGSLSSFSSPAVSVNALNRLRHNNDLYFALFEPSDTPHWHGNLKKYQLKQNNDPDPAKADPDGDGENDLFIAGKDGKPAVVNGLFATDSISFWALNNAADGSKTADGGAAHRMFTYDSDLKVDSRKGKVYTYLADSKPGTYNGSGVALHALDEVTGINKDAGAESLTQMTKYALGQPGLSDDEFVDRIKWLRGVDVKDENFDGDTTDARPVMGGILHTEPVVVNYSTDETKTPPTQTNVIMTTTNDGVFHLFKTKYDTSDKERLEHSAVIPKRLLKGMEPLYTNLSGSVAHRLDSNIEVWRYNHNPEDDNDIDDANDHVYAYFGQRRGGNAIFAFDITNPAVPKLLWDINPAVIARANVEAKVAPFRLLGQTWSPPKHAKVLMPDSANTLVTRDVVVFGGGYDTDNDTANKARSLINPYQYPVGNAIFMVDAKTGKLIWWAGGIDPIINAGNGNATILNPDLAVAEMKHSFPSDIRLLDLNGDGLLDKMFATDMGGQVWRFDVQNTFDTAADINDSNKTALAGRITGGVIADLQVDSGGSLTKENNRRAYYPPDVSVMQDPAKSEVQLAVAIGTGYRAHPLNLTVKDRLYILKYDDVTSTPDYSAVKLTPEDLLDITTEDFNETALSSLSGSNQNKLSNSGWFINLAAGEKSLSESVTVDGVVFFNTYTPPVDVGGTTCNDDIGSGKSYILNLFDGRAVIEVVDSSTLDENDRAYNLNAPGIPPSPKVVYPDIDGVSGKLIVGREILPVNIVNRPQLTYWLQEHAQE